MASRIMYPIKHLNPEVVVISGSFAPNGSSAIDATSNKGRGFSVAYTTTGKYTITLADAYADILCCMATLQLAATDDKILQIRGAIDVTTAKTVVLEVRDISGAAAADISADAANRIHFVLFLQNSSLSVV